MQMQEKSAVNVGLYRDIENLSMTKISATLGVKVGSGGWMGGFSAIRSATQRSIGAWIYFSVSGVYCCLLCQLVIVNWFAFVSHCGFPLIIVRWSLYVVAVSQDNFFSVKPES